MVSEYVCIDGDAEFSSYLKHNLRSIRSATCIFHQLSRATSLQSGLVRTHAGTASAQGNDRVETDPLDYVFNKHAIGAVDVLKVDVDGFDGEVLAGAQETLKRDRPGVIFEWHPGLCKQTANSWLTAFETLRSVGYSRSVWFNKFGEFSHFANNHDTDNIERLARFCIAGQSLYDWHYDVISLPDEISGRDTALADLRFASKSISRY
jgi:hypothetical protein